MECKLNDNNLSTNIIDLIDPSEKIKIDEYLQYLKCYKCNEIMIEPKFCFTCNFSICQKCKICSHTLSQSRHIKLLLDKILFKCKFHSVGCKGNIKYLEIRQHLLNCKFFDEKLLNVHKEQKFHSISALPIKLIPNQSENIYENSSFVSSDQIFNSYKISDYEGKISVKCFKCEASFHFKNEFIQHFKNCNILTNINTEFKEELLTKFYEAHEELQSKFVDFIFEKIRENKNLAIRNVEQYESLLISKKEGIRNFDKFNLKFSNEDYLKENLELESLSNEEVRLVSEKQNLIEKCNQKIEELSKIKERNEGVLKEELDCYRNTIVHIELEEKWAKEDLETTLFVNDFGERCNICGNEESGKNKYLCQNCRGKYCVEKCCKQCKNCNKYICPKDNKQCQLCQKMNYCDSCQKKCFYQGCTNTFCPDCYKKNEHQARNSNINCKFFTCERDQVCDCLMTSLFCSKCEKRLCNKCLMNDKEHFAFLK